MPSGLPLNEADFHAILAAVEVEIQSAIAETKSRREKAAAAAKATRQAIKAKASPPAKFSKEQSMSSISEDASAVAMSVCLGKQRAGERADFKAEHDRIMDEFRKDPRGTRARYARQITNPTAPTPPRGGAPFAFEDLGIRSTEIARKRLGPNASSRELSQERRKVLDELLTAAAGRQSVADFAAANKLDPAAQQAIEGFGSLTQQASSIAINKTKEQGGSFVEHYAAAIAELRRKLFAELNS